MSINGAKREFFLKLHSKKHPQYLSDIIGEEIANDSIKLELYIKWDKKKKKFIDLYAVTRDRDIPIYAEYQITKTDTNNHFKTKVKFLINNIEKGIIIWVAKEFNPSHLSMVKHELQYHAHKLINFYAVQIHPEVYTILDYLDNLQELEVWDQLERINMVDKPYLLVDYHEQIPLSYKLTPYQKQNDYDFGKNVERYQYLWEQIQIIIPYFPNHHCEKNINNSMSRLTIGAGKDGISYMLSLSSKGKAYCQIYFDQSQNEWYYFFKNHEQHVRKQIDRNIKFQKRKITYYLHSDINNIPATTEVLIQIYERFILYFSPFLYKKNTM